ncbi:MAG: hypothetical protein K8S98_10725 [Planctomycetes bacterium]|nr:hypothetical protein [Planctomycetota bacterium]
MHRWLFASLVSSSLGAQAPSPDVGIFRHREELTELTFRDTEGRPVVSDEQVGLIEREIESGLGVPAGWRVVLRRIRDDGSRDVLSTLSQTEDAELLNACLVDPAGRELEVSTSLDLRWVRLGNVVLLGEGGVTNFTREQPAKRAAWFPLRSIPILLETLEHELARGLPADCVVESVSLESAQPLSDPPSVRAYVWFTDDPTSRSSFGAAGVLALPRAAGHAAGFAFTGSQVCGDSVIGPINDTTTFRDSLEHQLEIHDTLALCTAWSTRVFPDAGSGGFWIQFSERRRSPWNQYGYSLYARAAALQPDGSDPRFAIGGVELSSDGLRAVLDALSSEYDPACAVPLMVYGCPELHEIHAVFCDLPLYGVCSVRAPALRLVLDEDGDSLLGVARVAVRAAYRIPASDYDQWTAEFADGCRSDLWIPRPVMCSLGDDRAPHGTFDEHELGFVGGLVRSSLFGR